MRRKGWLAITLVITLPVMLFAASCAKKVVQTRAQTQSASMTEPEVRKAPDSSTEKAGQAGRPDEDRLSAEAAAREAAAREAAAREAAAREAAAREAAQWVFFNEHVPFAFDSSLLSDQARQILHGKAEYLRSNPGLSVTVEGHCDDRGTNAYNVALGERRAASVKIFLVDLGIGTDRLNTVSYGEQRPVAVGRDEVSWAKNRRAQFVVN